MSDEPTGQQTMSANVQEFPDDQARMLRAARAYVEKGWAVFPLYSIGADGQCNCGTPNCVDAGKHPRIAKGVKGASKDLAQIEEWWGPDAPLSNIGLATGNVSGVTVLDVDTADGKPGAATWAELIKEGGEPDTLTARTGSGGFHMFFAYNSAMKTSSNTLGPGVDCRSDGGYVVMTPSKHRSGGRYSWENWSSAPIAALPAHLTKKKETRGRPKKDDLSKRKWTVEEVARMLEVIPATDRDDWRHYGIILGREFKCSDAAWELYVEWSEKEGGKKGRNHDEIMHEAFYTLSQEEPAEGSGRTMASIIAAAKENGWVPRDGTITHDKFIYYAPSNDYIYRTTRQNWTAAAVDAACAPINDAGKIVRASDWLKFNMLASSMTSSPRHAEDYLTGHDVDPDGEIVESTGAVYNTYVHPPEFEGGDPAQAGPFLEHVQRIFPGPAPAEGDLTDAEQFLAYMAHRVQRPWEKSRYALLIAGEQGTGKDTCIEFCIPAIGRSNVADIAPSALESGFNEYVAKSLVRVNEAANLQDTNKWAFNERMKTLIAGNPEQETINPKYGKKYVVRVYCGVVLTTNHLATGIYIPPGDRRYDVLQSATKEEMGIADKFSQVKYFDELYKWFNSGGKAHVAAYLRSLDLSRFSPNTGGQRKSEAYLKTVSHGMESDAWLTDAMEEIGNPDFVRADWILDAAEAAGENKAQVRAKLSAAMGRSGMELVPNPKTADHRWKIAGKWRTVWKKKTARDPTPEQIASLHQDRF